MPIDLTASPDEPRKRLSRDQAGFLPAALEVLETPASPLGRAVGMSICALLLAGVAWAWIGTMDVVASAQGKIIPTGRIKLIQPADPGVVKAIHVTEGQAVKAGDVLIELDPTSAMADRDSLRRDQMVAQIEVARLAAMAERPEAPDAVFRAPAEAATTLLDVQRSLMVSKTAEQRAKLASLDAELTRRQAEARSIAAQVGKLEATIPLVRKRSETRRYLADKQFGSEITALEVQQQLVEQERELMVQQAKLKEAEASITAAREARSQSQAEYVRGIAMERVDAEKRLAGLTQELIKAEQRGTQRTLTAPVDGTVQQLAANTVGGVVTAAQALMVVVPADSRLEVQANIQNKDIGFVHPGQRAAVKVETFNFTRYGYLEGTVESVSTDAIDDQKQGLVYAARIRLDKSAMTVDGRDVQLGPGMAVTAEIKTGQRKLIEYVLEPLLRYRREALQER